MPKAIKLISIAIVLLLQTTFSVAFAQEEPSKPTLKVLVSPVAPMVIENEDGSFTGFDIELMNAIAADNGYEVVYEKEVFGNLITRLVNGDADAALAGITITDAREALIDFTHRYMDSGLRIMVNIIEQSWISSLVNLDALFKLGYALGGFMLFLACFAVLLFFVDRPGDSDTFDDEYVKGLAEAYWFSLVTSTTTGYGKFVPEKWPTRILAGILMLIGSSVFSLFGGAVGATLTMESSGLSDISSIDDLRRKKVATIKGSTSVATVRSAGAKPILVESIEEAYKLLDQNKVEAVVYDMPALMHQEQLCEDCLVVGSMFDRQQYGIPLRAGSPYREAMSRSILKFHENGTYDELYEKWLGASPE